MKIFEDLLTLFKGSKRDDLALLTGRKKEYLGLVINGFKKYSPKLDEKLNSGPLYGKQESDHWVKEIKIYRK